MNGSQFKKYVHDRCTEDGECWIWQGVVNKKRPQMALGGKTLAVRRELWKRLKNANLQPAQLITTTCEVHGCVNPAHLCERTMSEVQTRMGELGTFSSLQRRISVAMGKRAQAKLTAQDVAYIRASDEPLKVLASRYGVSAYCISSARTGRTWKNYSSPFAGLGA